jgi:zinc protease
MKDGLSNGAGENFSKPVKDDTCQLNAYAIGARQIAPKVETAFNEELAKALKDGFTAGVVDMAKKINADRQAVSIAEKGSINGILAGRERWAGPCTRMPGAMRQ